MVHNIVINGSGPAGLFFAIFAYLKYKVNIELLDNRDIKTEIGRLRQIIILKKSYKSVQYLFEIPNLINEFNDFVECVLVKTYNNNSFSEGPYECVDKKISKLELNHKNVIGVTITITNLQLCLISYIEKYTDINLILNFEGNINDYAKKYNSDDVIIVGCSGIGGSIRNQFTSPTLETFLTKYPQFKSSKYPIKYEQRNLFMENNAGLDTDSYMLIVRYPIISENKNTKFGFGWTHKNKTAKKSRAIMITNYLNNKKSRKFIDSRYKNIVKNKKIAYRQLYYYVDVETFSQLGDCGFWTSCSIDDYENRRLLSDLFIKKSSPNVNKTINEFLMNSNKKKNYTVKPNEQVFRSPFYKDDLKIQQFKTTNKYSHILFRIIAYGTNRNPLLDFKKGEYVKIVMIDFSKRPYITHFKKTFIVRIIDCIHISHKSSTAHDNFFPELYIQYIVDFENNADLNEVNDLYKKGYTISLNTMNQSKQDFMVNTILKDIQLFNKKDEINMEDLKKYTELVRIWTPVRFARSIFDTKNDYFYCITGDEAIAVDPMTGRGVSNAILLTKTLTDLLSKNNKLDMKYIKNIGIHKYEKFVYELAYECLQQGEDIHNKFERMNFSFDKLFNITTINLLNPSTIYNNYRDLSVSKDKVIKYEDQYFEKHRKHDIVEYIKLLEKECIFLQEVNETMYNELLNNEDISNTHILFKSNFNENMVYMKGENIKTINKPDYRVILFPKILTSKYSIIEEQIPLVSMDYGVLKNTVALVLQSTNSDNYFIIILINVHLNRNNNAKDNKMFELFVNDLKHKYHFDETRDKIVIGGDFNENIIKIKKCSKHGINMNTHYSNETDFFLSNIKLNITYDKNITPLDFNKRHHFIKNGQAIPKEKSSFTDHLIVKASALIY